MTRLDHLDGSAPSVGDRRRSRRIDVLGQLQVHLLSQPMPILMREISHGGFSVETTTPIPSGVWHRFSFHFDQTPPLHVGAVSIHGEPASGPASLPTFVTGFSFGPLDLQTSTALRALLSEIAALLVDE